MDGRDPIRKAYDSILGHDFEQAIEWFEKAIAEEPENAGYHYKLSITYSRSGKLNKALLHAEKAFKIDSSQQDYLYHYQNLQALDLINRAEKLLQQAEGKEDMAIMLLNEAVRLDPLAMEGYLLLGMAHANLKEYDKAVSALHHVLRLDPEHASAERLLDEYKNCLKSELSQKKGYD